MSSYLERLVGRHGGPAAVRARVVSRFEGDLVGRPVGGDTSAPEGPPSAIATASSMETAAHPRADRCRGIHGSRGAGDRAIGHRHGARRQQMGRDRPVAAEPSMPSPATDAPRPERTDDPSGPARHDAPARTRGPEGTTVVPVTIRRADPPPIGTPADGRAAPSRRSPTAVPSEPDVVHVHIGRVEVRAIVPAPEPSRPARRPARPAPLSLDRYLSGERRT